MEKIIVDKCPACEPINEFIETLLDGGFKIIEQKIEDYHFHQLYFKLEGKLKGLENTERKGFKRIENKFICECHWSTVDLLEEKII